MATHVSDRLCSCVVMVNYYRSNIGEKSRILYSKRKHFSILTSEVLLSIHNFTSSFIELLSIWERKIINCHCLIPIHTHTHTQLQSDCRWASVSLFFAPLTLLEFQLRIYIAILHSGTSSIIAPLGPRFISQGHVSTGTTQKRLQTGILADFPLPHTGTLK